MNRKISFTVGEYYHVYNRGVEKRNIFVDTRDRDRFQHLLYLVNGSKPIVYRLIQGETLYKEAVGSKIVAIGAYVLMPNHFHLLLRETSKGGVSNFLKKLTTGYTMYFNKKYERVGPLFQGVFKAEHVDRDEYLRYLFAYIHLNPVKLYEPHWKETGLRDFKGAEKFIKQYHYSSFLDFLGDQRGERKILDLTAFPTYFRNRFELADFHKNWMEFKPKPHTR